MSEMRRKLSLKDISSYDSTKSDESEANLPRLRLSTKSNPITLVPSLSIKKEKPPKLAVPVLITTDLVIKETHSFQYLPALKPSLALRDPLSFSSAEPMPSVKEGLTPLPDCLPDNQTPGLIFTHYSTEDAVIRKPSHSNLQLQDFTLAEDDFDEMLQESIRDLPPDRHSLEDPRSPAIGPYQRAQILAQHERNVVDNLRGLALNPSESNVSRRLGLSQHTPDMSTFALQEEKSIFRTLAQLDRDYYNLEKAKSPETCANSIIDYISTHDEPLTQSPTDGYCCTYCVII
jgi:hypothetical protein